MRITKHPTLLILPILLSGLASTEGYASNSVSASFKVAQVDELPELPPPPSPDDFSIPENAPALPEIPTMDGFNEGAEELNNALEEEGALENIVIPSAPTLPAGNTEEDDDTLPSLPEAETLNKNIELEKSQPFGTSRDSDIDLPDETTPFTITPPTTPATFGEEPETTKEDDIAFPRCKGLIKNLKNCTSYSCTTDPKNAKDNISASYKVLGIKNEGCGFDYTDPAYGQQTCLLSDRGIATFVEALDPYITEGKWNPGEEFSQLASSQCAAVESSDDDGPRRPRNTGLILPNLDGKDTQDSSKNIQPCSQFSTMLKRCAPYSCEQPSFDKDDNFVTKRTITGLDEGLCEYKESLPHGATLQCRYTENSRKATGTFHEMLFSGNYEAGTNEEIIYNRARRNECKIFGDDGKEIDYDFFIDFKNLPTEVTEWGDPKTPEGDCETLNEKLKSCEPFYCKGNDPIQEKFFNRTIEVERKIIGSFDDMCYYLDKASDKPLSGCKYSRTSSTSGSRCSDSILIEIADKGGMFANLTEAEEAADTTKKADAKAKPDPALSVYKPKLHELPVLDYKTQKLSPLIHKKEYIKQNAHLPPAMYLEEYKYMAYDVLNKGDLTSLTSLIDRLTELYAKETQDEENRIWNGLDVRGKHGNTLLIHSIMAGRYTAARALLGKGANPDAQNEEGTTALHAAAYSGRMDMVNLLLDMGAKANIADNYGRTALTLATEKEYNDIIQALLKKSSDPNMAMDDGTTPLITVVMKNNMRAVRRLIQNGADVNYPDNNGMTALMHASHLGYAPLVELLLSNGADIFAQDYVGRTAEMLAAQSGHLHIARHLASLAIDSRM